MFQVHERLLNLHMGPICWERIQMGLNPNVLDVQRTVDPHLNPKTSIWLTPTLANTIMWYVCTDVD